MSTRDYVMKTRLTDSERDVLEKLAADAGCATIADYVRMSLFGPRHMRKLPGADELIESRRLIKSIANNVNQVTKKFHEIEKSGKLTEKQIQVYARGIEKAQKIIQAQARAISEFMVSIEHS